MGQSSRKSSVPFFLAVSRTGLVVLQCPVALQILGAGSPRASCATGRSHPSRGVCDLFPPLLCSSWSLGTDVVKVCCFVPPACSSIWNFPHIASDLSLCCRLPFSGLLYFVIIRNYFVSDILNGGVLFCKHNSPCSYSVICGMALYSTRFPTPLVPLLLFRFECLLASLLPCLQGALSSKHVAPSHSPDPAHPRPWTDNKTCLVVLPSISKCKQDLWELPTMSSMPSCHCAL